MIGNPGRLGWHPTGKDYPSDPRHTTEMQSSVWDKMFGAPAIGITAPDGVLHRVQYGVQNATMNFCLTSDDP